LRSLDFLPLRYRVSSWKIGTSLQIPIHAHGSLWISDSKDNAVHILNPRAPEVPGRVAVGRNPIGLLELSAGVAVAHAGDGMVYLMDPTGKVVKTVNVGGHPVGFGNFGVVVAVCNAPDGKVSLLDAATLSVTREILVTDGRMSIYWCNAVGTELWTSSGVGGLGHIARVDPSQGKLISRIMFQPGATRQMLVHDQRVWIAFPDKGAVHVLDAASRDKVFDIPAGNYPVGIADFDGAMWVSALRGGSLQRFDPGSGARIGHPLLLGQGVGAMTVADGSLWIANALTGSLVRVTPRGP
jgi:streptogramin lyase